MALHILRTYLQPTSWYVLCQMAHFNQLTAWWRHWSGCSLAGSQTGKTDIISNLIDKVSRKKECKKATMVTSQGKNFTRYRSHTNSELHDGLDSCHHSHSSWLLPYYLATVNTHLNQKYSVQLMVLQTSLQILS